MPTYDYQCSVCAREASVLQSIGEYSRNPLRPTCFHGGELVVMDRRLSVVPAMSGLANALAGDRHYDGLRATDGTDISSRSKHREYMKSHGYTTADDFTGQWSAELKEREARRLAQHTDKELRAELSQQIYTAVAQPS